MNIQNFRREATLAYSRRNRNRKARFALDFARQRGVQSVLLVGVSPLRVATENAIEQVLIDAGLNVTASGISNPEGSGTGSRWPNYLVADGRNLPFENDAFDLVYSNAVIEHVGGQPAQKAFVNEHARVGRHFILTCPNRWFPIESHTDVLFKHWMPNYTDERGSITRLLGPRDLRALLPDGGRVHGTVASPTLTATSG